MASNGVSQPTADEPQYVIGALVQQCRGESSFWNSLPWSILPPALKFSTRQEFVIDELAIASDVWHNDSVSPPIPPPRTV
ncbi:MAG: hypothetical protein ACKVT0_23255 [Planctomycetaceae bacterium]